jgi:ATP/maltotriose-dependent transcriptional regulator MalT
MGIRLIGRDAELRALLATVDRSMAGPGRIVLISGEAGIGKSRLAAEVVAAAAGRGFTTLEGRAHPLHAGLAYAPIVEALRPHLSQDEADLNLLLAGPRHSSVEPTLAKARMFEAVTNVIQQLAPILLFIDDLHWADLGTVELAHYISHNASGVLVLVTCRDPSGPLRDLAMAIRRDDPRDQLALSPLTDPAVAELAAEVLGAAPPTALLEGLTRRARGNPLFVTALTSAPLDRRALPTIVRDVVLGRLHGLSEPARRLIEIVAVAGDAGSDDLLRAIWGDGDFDGVLRGLVQSGLVTEHIVGRTVAYRVAHPLYAEVAYSELTANERRHLHAALAETIDRERPGDVLALAPHYLGAGDLVEASRTAEVLADAGWRALEIHAEDEAVRYLTAALAEATAPDLVIRLLDALGRVHQGAGRLAEASAAWSRAIELAQQECDDRLGPLAYWLALLEAERGDFPAAGRYVQIASQAGRPSDPAMATEYTVLGMHFALRGQDQSQLREGSKELIADGGAAAHLGRATLAVLDKDWDTARREAELTIAQDNQTDGRLSTMVPTVARTQLLMISTLSGDLTTALRHAEAIRDTPAVYEYSMFNSAAHYYVAFTRYLSGDLPGALEEINKGVTLEQRANPQRMLAWMLMVRGWMLIEAGRLADGEADLREAERLYGGGIPAEVGLAMLHSAATTALALYQGHPEQAPPLPDYATELHDPLMVGFWLLSAGEAAIAAGDKQRGAEIVARLRKAGKSAVLVDALADRLAGLVGDPAMSLSAADRLDAIGALGFGAQARLEWAGQTHDPAPIQHCVDVFEQAGMTIWLDRARQLAKTLGVRVARKSSGLTKRESEVVHLLGEGLSNADIAARLFLSERTVESHLRNSYAKLGLTSRITLARWATENSP